MRSNIIRGVVAFLLWGLLLLCFLTMLRANNMIATNLNIIRDGAVSPEQIQTERLVTETARGFVFNWATYNGDEQDYQNRLKLYGKNDNYILGSNQKCNSVEVLEVKKEKDFYRVKLKANISRATTIPDNQAHTLPKELIIKREPPIASVWKNTQETVEVSIKDQTIIGYPVLIPSEKPNEAKTIGNNKPPEGFTTFGKQMIDLYFRGEDLSNYTDKEIKSLGGYILKNCELIGYEDGKSLFKATVTQSSDQPAVKEMEQYIFLEAKKADKWQLIRLGAF